MKQLTIWKNLLIILMLIIPSISFYSNNTNAQPSEIWVDDDFGPGTPGWQHNHFNGIQEGIDIVGENGTVYVNSGTYYENIIINKTINLIGEDKNTTTIDGGGGDIAVYVLADSVNLTGFTIQNSDDYVIHLYGSSNIILGNIITNIMGHGICLTGHSNTVMDNTISNSIDGIEIYSSSNTIIGNTITHNSPDGIVLVGDSNNIKGNNLINNHDGIIFVSSNNNTITGNTVTNNSHNGMELGFSSNNNTFIGNSIMHNTLYGFIFYNSSYNKVFHNNIMNNSVNAYDSSNNFWDNGYPFGGNYWNDYTGNDIYKGLYQDTLGGDGIGDIPYNITGGTNRDMYPLMHPWGENNPPIQINPYPSDGAMDIPVEGTPINLEIYDVENDSLWSEVWSNYTGSWIQYAGWNLGNESWRSTYFMPDYDEDTLWDIFDVANYYLGSGWIKRGYMFGFFDNDTVTDKWGMTNYNTIYYWSVNVTDNTIWTNLTYHFTTELGDVCVDDDADPSWYDSTHVRTIQEGIDNASIDDTVYVYRGTYYEHININKTITLIGENKNFTIVDGGGIGNVVNVSSNEVTLSGFTIRNSGPGEFAGISLSCNSTNNTITGNILTNNRHGIHLKYSSNNNIITSNIITDSYWSIHLTTSSENAIIGNTIKNKQHYCIYLEYSSNNNTITGNTITGIKNYDTHGIYLRFSSDNIITGNIITNNDYGIYLSQSKSNTITGNTFFNDGLYVVGSYQNIVTDNTVNGKPLIYLEGQSNILITNDTELGQIVLVNCTNITITNQELSNTTSGIHLFNSDNCIIVGNTLTYNSLTGGLYLGSSNNNTITGNTFKNNGFYGIYLCSSSRNNIIAGNTITNKHLIGIYLRNSLNNTIIDNIITNNSFGIYLEDSNNNAILGNIASNNSDGIYLRSSSSNTIVGNTLTKNKEYGIYLHYSYTPNKIYHNNFINNIQQAHDKGTNFWDNGYPSGGNYWNDYDGWDIYKGPNQDIPGGDGISDTSYNISGDSNQDRYPLMHPYSSSSNVYFQGLEPLYTLEYIEIAVTITPKEAIAGVQLDFLFDPDMLSIEWVAEGDIFSEYDNYFDPGIIDNTNGSLKNVVSLITTSGGNTTNQGSITIVAIRAKAIPGETSLNLSNVIVGESDGTPIDVSIINTTIMIYPHDRWDVNWDDRVNILDLIMIAQHWGETGDPCWISADVNCDGVINILDMVLVGQHWTG